MTGTGAPAAPHTVCTASYLLLGVSALALVGAVGSLFATPEFGYHHGRLDGSAAGVVAVLALGLVAAVAVVFGAVCGSLAYLVHRGSGTARTLTWVLGGLTVCVAAGLLLTGGYGEVSWYRTLVRVVAGSTLLLMLATAVLLASPPSHAHVRAARSPRPVPPPGQAGHGPSVGGPRPLPGHRPPPAGPPPAPAAPTPALPAPPTFFAPPPRPGGPEDPPATEGPPATGSGTQGRCRNP